MPVPRVSVVVPFYNNEDLLGDCLKSIAAQTLTDIEVLMVDDGSTDSSAEIAAVSSMRLLVVSGSPPHKSFSLAR